MVERVTPSMAGLVKALEDDGINGLRLFAQECPGCILSAIVQERVKNPPAWDEELSSWVEYDYKKESLAFFDLHRSIEQPVSF